MEKAILVVVINKQRATAPEVQKTLINIRLHY
jgi:hypothetical protein